MARRILCALDGGVITMDGERIFDTVIAGGGPSGVQCSIMLRRLGVDVLLVGDVRPCVHHASLSREPGWNTSDVSDLVSLRLAVDNLTALQERSVPVLTCWIDRAVRRDGLFESFANGRSFLSRTLVLATGAEGPREARTPVLPDLSSLEPELHEDGMLEVDRRLMTSIRGLYAVGDAAGGIHDSVSCAMGTGFRCAWSIRAELEEQADTAAA